MGSSFHMWSLHIVHFGLVLTSNSRSLLRKFFSSQWYSNISGGPTDFSVASSNSVFDILANSPTFSWSDNHINTGFMSTIQSSPSTFWDVTEQHDPIILAILKWSIIYNAITNLRKKLAEIADLYTKTLDLFFYCFLIALFSIDHPERLIVLHMDLSCNHHITPMLVPEIIAERLSLWSQTKEIWQFVSAISKMANDHWT